MINLKKLSIPTLIVVVMSASGCASKFANLPDNDTLLKEHTEQDGKACIRADRIRGWGALDDDVISVDAFGLQKYYLVTTMFSCRDIATSVHVGFSTSFTEFCGRGRDRIITRDESCQVQSIFEFDTRQDAFDAYEAVELKRNEMREELKQAPEDSGSDGPESEAS